MVDRMDIDALLVGALYGELTPADEARLTTHLESHPGDRNALDDLKVARQAVRESRIFEIQLDPPQAVSALLLQEAARRAPRRARSNADGEGWFARLTRSFIAHPAMAAATMLVLVLGVASTLYMRQGDEQFAEKTVSSPNAPTPAAVPQDQQALDRQRNELEQQLALEEGKLASERAAAGSAAPGYYQQQGSSFEVGLAEKNKAEDTGVEHRADGDALVRGGKDDVTRRAQMIPKVDVPTTTKLPKTTPPKAKPENIDVVDGMVDTIKDTTLSVGSDPARHTAAKPNKKAGIAVDTPSPSPKELTADFEEAKPTVVTKGASKGDDAYARPETDTRPGGAPSHGNTGTGSGASTGTGSVAGPTGGGAGVANPGFAAPPTKPQPQPGRTAPTTASSAPATAPPPPAPGPVPAASPTVPKPPADTKTVAKTEPKAADKAPPPPPPPAQTKSPAPAKDAAKTEKPAAKTDKADEAKNTEDVARAKSEHARAVSLVGSGKCPDAAKLLSNMASYAPNYYAQYVATDRGLKQCMAYINDQREKEAEKASKSRASKRVNADEPAANMH